jgi:hypothetical protein
MWGRMASGAAIGNRRAGRVTLGPQVALRPTCPTIRWFRLKVTEDEASALDHPLDFRARLVAASATAHAAAGTSMTRPIAIEKARAGTPRSMAAPAR